MPRSGIAELYGSSIFSFMRNIHTIIHSGFIPIYIPTNRIEGSPHDFQYSLFVDLLLMAILNDVRLYLVVLICISLIICNVEHLFMCPLAIHISSWKNVYLGHFQIFHLDCLFFVVELYVLVYFGY